jgi:hypothetical protein
MRIIFLKMIFDANHDCHLGKSSLMILNKIIMSSFEILSRKGTYKLANGSRRIRHSHVHTFANQESTCWPANVSVLQGASFTTSLPQLLSSARYF